jgi:hypothetical protein
MTGLRLYLSVLATAEDVETLTEWARVQAAIHRQDGDVVQVEARLVVDGEDGHVFAELLEI